MPVQPRTTQRIARVSGAINVGADDLVGTDIVGIATYATPSAQTTLQALLEFFGIVPFVLASRVVATISQAVVEDDDVALLINKTIPSATAIALPTPALGRILIFKDMAGNCETYNITLDAGTGNLINGLQTLVMNANWSTTMLIGMSATQWGTLL